MGQGVSQSPKQYNSAENKCVWCVGVCVLFCIYLQPNYSLVQESWVPNVLKAGL